MSKRAFTPSQIENLKREAKKAGKRDGVPHVEMLNRIAVREGFKSWWHLQHNAFASAPPRSNGGGSGVPPAIAASGGSSFRSLSATSIVEALLSELAYKLMNHDDRVVGAMAETNAQPFGLDCYDVQSAMFVSPNHIEFEGTLTLSGEQSENHGFNGDELEVSVAGVVTRDSGAWEIVESRVGEIVSNADDYHEPDEEEPEGREPEEVSAGDLFFHEDGSEAFFVDDEGDDGED